MKLSKKFFRQRSEREERQGCPVLKIWRSMPPISPKIKPEVPRMLKMRGDPRSDICIIAPPCDAHDYAQGTPLSNPAALVLHDLMKEILGINTQKCCVFSISRYALKANKANTTDIVEAFRKMIALRQFRLVITVGDDAFKFAFARGKKPSPSIFGNIMYVPETGHQPLFALPELLGLSVSIPEDYRTRMKILDWQNKTESRFRTLLEVLKPVVVKLGYDRN